MKATVIVQTTVEIDVDDNIVLRCTENHNDEGVPVTDGTGWRDSMYPLDTPRKVFEHLAFNIVSNGSELSHLDGWADLPDTAMRVRMLGTEQWVDGGIAGALAAPGEAT